MTEKIEPEKTEAYIQFVSDCLPAIQQLNEKYFSENALDFSIESLEKISCFIINIKKQNVSEDEVIWLKVRIAYYVAQVLIDHRSGSWGIDQTKSSYSYGRPVITFEGSTIKLDLIGFAHNVWEKEIHLPTWYVKLNEVM